MTVAVPCCVYDPQRNGVRRKWTAHREILSPLAKEIPKVYWRFLPRGKTIEEDNPCPQKKQRTWEPMKGKQPIRARGSQPCSLEARHSSKHGHGQAASPFHHHREAGITILIESIFQMRKRSSRERSHLAMTGGTTWSSPHQETGSSGRDTKP